MKTVKRVSFTKEAREAAFTQTTEFVLSEAAKEKKARDEKTERLRAMRLAQGKASKTGLESPPQS